MKFSAKQIDQIFEGIYSGKYNPKKMPKDLYFAISKQLRNGVYDGYGKVFDMMTKAFDADKLSAEGIKEYKLLSELRTNIYMFSAAKTYQQVRQMSDMLIKDGSVQSFADFKKDTLSVFEQYNENWLQAEYVTAIGQASMAAKWNDIIANEKILPNLQFSTAGNPCPICAPMEGLIAPVDDKIWRTKSPLIHFSCMCILLQLDGEAKATSKGDVNKINKEMDGKMDEVFKSNPYFDKMIFNKNHPYFTNVPRSDKPFAKRNFGMPIPKTDKDASI